MRQADDRDLRADADARWSGYDEPLVTPEPRTRERLEHVDEVRDEAHMPESGDDPGTAAPLFSREEAEQLRSRWESVQASFVDEPRRAVDEADVLVRAVMDRLTDGFSRQHERLEREVSDTSDVSTEDLRVALRHYRSFFDRLLRI